jgi:hypothetical protein
MLKLDKNIQALAVAKKKTVEYLGKRGKNKLTLTK